MFKWFHEYSMEVDAPLKLAWDFYCNLGNWSKWEERFDDCIVKGDLKTGSAIRAKIKNKPLHVLILATEVKPYDECKFLINQLFFKQESLSNFQEISPGRTRITFKTCVISILTPFMKSTFLKNAEKTYAKCEHVFVEIAGKV